MLTVKQVKEALGNTVDQVSRAHNGNVVIRKSYHQQYADMTSKDFMLQITEKLNLANFSFTVSDYYNHRQFCTQFREDQSVAQGSHLVVKLQ